jgi:hypothetical protein
VSIAGCSSGTATATADGPVAFVTTDPDGGDAALLSAVVQVDDECVLVVGEEGTRWLPVFHAPTASSDGRTLAWEGRSYAPGDPIELGGGMSDDASRVDHVPAGCAYDAVWFVST